MPKPSPARKSWPMLQGVNLLNRGKVRDTYLLPCGKMLIVATDAISIFDFVLNALVPLKGVILTAMSVFWFKMLEKYGIKHHMVAYGSAIDEYLPGHLRNDPDLQSRALVVERLEMVDDVEFIPRAVLTGSAVKPYMESGQIFGRPLPPGLQDGDELPYPTDTATTKAKEGHDEHLTADDVRRKYPEQVYLEMRIFAIAQAYAKKCGILLADSKFEFGKDGTLGDEVLTPDSSRFWPLAEWLAGRNAEKRKAPPSFDKQIVREWGKTMGINDSSKFNPEKETDVDNVHAMSVPQKVLDQTTCAYRYIFWRLTGMTIEKYLRTMMNVNFPARRKPKILVVCGSETDKPDVMSAIEFCVAPSDMTITMHVMSCHRNPEELRQLAESIPVGLYDAILYAGGMAFAAPGVLDAWLHFFHKDIQVIGVALGKEGSQNLLAAELSISQIPGQPVVINELTGKPYSGPGGLVTAFHRIMDGELPPPKPRKEKPAQTDVYKNY